MPKITINSFAGEIPKIDPYYLPETHAVEVDGAKLTRGNLAPMRAPVTIQTLADNADRVFLWGSTFLGWPYDADAVPGPIASNRLYVTRANDTPQMIANGTTYALALPNPADAPTATNEDTPDPDLQELVLYAFTWVTSLGEESGPSPLSNAVLWSEGNVVEVAFTGSAPAGRLITHRRLYRSVTTTLGATELFYVADISVSAASYSHNNSTDPTQTAITTSNAGPAPDGLRGLISMPNGMMAGFDGRELWFCAPYLPHSWPSEYVLTVNDDIVGLCAFGQAVAVLTTGTPYVAQGLSPDAMAMTRLEVDYPCVAKRGIVDMGYAAIYPSTDGLVQVGQNGANLISKPLWDRDQWLALNPASIRAARYMGRYAMSYQPIGAPARLFAFIDVSGELPYLIPVTSDPFIDLAFHIETGRLFALRAADARTVVSIDDGNGDVGAYRWKSRPFKLPAPIGMGVVKMEGRATPGPAPQFEAKVYRGGELIRTITTFPASFARLPGDKISDEWQIEVSGNMTITKITLAGSPDELWQ